MPRLEHVRETVSGPLNLDYLLERARAGWRLAAVEWVREVEGEESEAGMPKEEPPYGMRVASDCTHLEENPIEMQALAMMMELIVQDLPLGRIAHELNLNGFRTRGGARWTQQAVFNLLPRLIDVGPRILSSQEWPARRQRLQVG